MKDNKIKKEAFVYDENKMRDYIHVSAVDSYIAGDQSMIEGLADEENSDIMISLEDACDWLWDEIYPRIDDDRIRDILMDDSYRANLVDAFKTAMIKKYNK